VLHIPDLSVTRTTSTLRLCRASVSLHFCCCCSCGVGQLQHKQQLPCPGIRLPASQKPCVCVFVCIVQLQRIVQRNIVHST
jgi:hypothetical protein